MNSCNWSCSIGADYYKNGIFLHASANLFPAGVVAFLGHSTSGKSTVATKFLSKYLVVSDDVLFVFQKGGKWFCANGDYRNFNPRDKSDNRIFLNDKFETVYPIRLFARIWKQPTASGTKLDSAVLCKYLMDACMEVDIQNKTFKTAIRKCLFESVASIARTTSGCDLNFEKKSSIKEIEKVLIHIDPELFKGIKNV